MMRFITLTLENVFSHKSTTIDLSGKGLALIVGDNGAGKSSILKALFFVLFGIGTDSVVNNMVGKNACVTLIGYKEIDLSSPRFGTSDSDVNVLAGDKFKIQRYRKHSKHKNNLYFSIEGSPVDASTNTDLQNKLERYLGLDYKAFTNIAAFSSEMVQFCNSTDVERKAIFEKILQDLDQYNEYHQTAKEKLAELVVTTELFQHEIEKDERELSVIKKVIESEEEKAERFEELRKEKIDKIETELVELDKKYEIRTNLQDKRQRYRLARDKINDWFEDHPPVVEEIFKLEQKLINLDYKITKELKSEMCPTCNQKIEKSYKVRETKRLTSEMKEVSKDLIDLNKKNNIRTKFAHKETEIEEKINELKFKLTKYDNVIDKMKELEEELEDVREKVNDSEETLKKWRSKVKKLSKRISTHQRKIKSAEEDKLYYEEVVRGFSKIGIPNVIISRALHLLEQRTNEYLDTLTNGSLGISLSGFTTTKKGTVRNKIGIDVISSNGIVTYDSYSGGERQRLNIAFLLALRDVAQANKGVSINCLFLDEILDLSLDSQGATDVLALLQHKKRDIESIFIISPKEEFIKNSSGNFDTSLKVFKEGGFSKIIGD